MRTVTVRMIWSGTTQVEVPDDWVDDGTLDDVLADQLDSSGCYLADWDVLDG